MSVRASVAFDDAESDEGGGARASVALVDGTSSAIDESDGVAETSGERAGESSGASGEVEAYCACCTRVQARRDLCDQRPEEARLARYAVEYQFGRYLPCMASEIADPYQTLRHFYDAHEQKIRARLERRATAASTRRPDEPASPRHKKLSLRRKGKKEATVSTDQMHALQQIEALGAVRAEVSEMVHRLQVAHDAFVDALCTLVDIRDARRQRELIALSAYAMLDTSVAAHSLLIELRLCDNKYFAEIGRAVLQAHVYAYSLAQGVPIEIAMRRLKQIVEGADVWLTERLRSTARLVTPVLWRLRPDTHERMTDDDLKYVERRVMRSTPLIMLGVLHMLRFDLERDDLLKQLLMHFC